MCINFGTMVSSIECLTNRYLIIIFILLAAYAIIIKYTNISSYML